MKKLLLVLAIAATVVACNNAAEPATPAADTTAPAPTAVDTTAPVAVDTTHAAVDTTKK